jgi:hypothetical protein
LESAGRFDFECAATLGPDTMRLRPLGISQRGV